MFGIFERGNVFTSIAMMDVYTAPPLQLLHMTLSMLLGKRCTFWLVFDAPYQRAIIVIDLTREWSTYTRVPIGSKILVLYGQPSTFSR